MRHAAPSVQTTSVGEAYAKNPITFLSCIDIILNTMSDSIVIQEESLIDDMKAKQQISIWFRLLSFILFIFLLEPLCDYLVVSDDLLRGRPDNGQPS